MSNLKARIKNIPVIGKMITSISLWIRRKPFRGSSQFWEERYAEGGTSGSGSFNRLAEFKAETINHFVEEKGIESVIELGCGDGNQLKLANYPKYLGTDVAKSAIDRCEELYLHDDTRTFRLIDPLKPLVTQINRSYELGLSLDVIYHLVEQDVFEQHMNDLFSVSMKYVIIYSSNEDTKHMYHEKHREFTKWIEQNVSRWKLVEKIDNKYPFDPDDPENTSKADFYIYEKK